VRASEQARAPLRHRTACMHRQQQQERCHLRPHTHTPAHVRRHQNNGARGCEHGTLCRPTRHSLHNQARARVLERHAAGQARRELLEQPNRWQPCVAHKPARCAPLSAAGVQPTVSPITSQVQARRHAAAHVACAAAGATRAHTRPATAGIEGGALRRAQTRQLSRPGRQPLPNGSTASTTPVHACERQGTRCCHSALLHGQTTAACGRGHTGTGRVQG
jgi:hypothetical protein